MTINFSGYIEMFCSAAIMLWAFRRSRYMSKKTPAIDQAFLILLGIGAAANFLIPACVMLRIEIDNSIMFWHGPAFFSGLAGWLIFPTIRGNRKDVLKN